MEILCLLDKDSRTKLSDDLKFKIDDAIKQNGHHMETVELGRNDLYPCLGCLHCLTKKPGICISKDKRNELQNKALNCGLIIFMTPVLFGNFSSIIKNAVDKGIGSQLGTDRQPSKLFIGYGDDIDDEEKSTFIDITARHMGSADIIHPEFKKTNVEAVVTRSAGDNKIISDKIKSLL